MGSLHLLVGFLSLAVIVRSANAMTLSECTHAKNCTITGKLEISSDGHTWVGILHTGKGQCINVSLPFQAAMARSKLSPQRVVVTGRVIPYAYEGDEVRVNGRRIGYGLCGPQYIFAEQLKPLK